VTILPLRYGTGLIAANCKLEHRCLRSDQGMPRIDDPKTGRERALTETALRLLESDLRIRENQLELG